MFLFLTTYIPIFLGLSHSCTASIDNPLSSDSNRLDFQQSQASGDPALINLILDLHGFLCRSKEPQLKKQLEGLLPQLEACLLHQEYCCFFFSSKGPWTGHCINEQATSETLARWNLYPSARNESLLLPNIIQRTREKAAELLLTRVADTVNILLPSSCSWVSCFHKQNHYLLVWQIPR